MAPTFRLRPLCLCLALAVPAAQAAPVVWNAASGDWHTATSWLPSSVPTPTDDARINNGGTASYAADATARSLDVGAEDGSGSAVSGFLEGTMGLLRSLFDTRVGVAGGNVASANGSITAAGDGIRANGMTAGSVVANSGAAATANGTVATTGAPITLDTALRVGATTNATGATADGTVTVTGGDLTGTPVIGTDFGSDATTRATGQVTIDGGDLHLTGGAMTVGRASGGTATASGRLDVSGAITTDDFRNGTFAPSITIGLADGGTATGVVNAGAIDTAVNPVGDVAVGSTLGANGSSTATGTLSIGSGTLNTNGSVDIGTTLANGGQQATGRADLSGVLVRGDGTDTLEVGHALSLGLGSAGAGSATGTAAVSGVAGFNRYRIGVVQGTVLNDMSANGTLAAGTGGIAGAGSNSALRIGVSEGLANNNQVTGTGARATGDVTSLGDVTGFSSIDVGTATHVGTGIGRLITRDARVTSANSFNVGAASSNFSTATTPGSNPTGLGTGQLNGGSLEVGGLIVVGRSTILDTTANPVQDAARADGRLSLEAVNVASPTADLVIGQAFSGIGGQATSHAEGRVFANGGALSIRDITIGAGSGGQASAIGEMHLDGANLTARNLTIGQGSGATGIATIRNATAQLSGDLQVAAFNAFAAAPTQGLLALEAVTMTVAGDAFVGPGFPSGSGELRLTDSELSIDGGLRVGFSSNGGTLFGLGTVALDRSLAAIGDLLFLDVGATLDFAVHGIDRGNSYGAFDVNQAVLDGDLLVDLSTLVPTGPAHFDLIVSGLADGIDGMFASQSFLGLASGFVASTAIVSDLIGGQMVEIFRLTIAEATVPEPGMLALVALALSALLVTRARGQRRLARARR